MIKDCSPASTENSCLLSHSKNVTFLPSPNPFREQVRGAAIPHQLPAEAAGLRETWDSLPRAVTTELLQLRDTYPWTDLHISKSETPWSPRSTKIPGLHDLGHIQNQQRSLRSSREHGFEEATQLGNTTGETQGCSAKGRLSQGPTFLQHPLQAAGITLAGTLAAHPAACISPQQARAATPAQLGEGLQTGFFFPPFLLLSGSLQHTVKPFIDKEGKGFTTVFKASPGSRKEPLPAHTILGSTGTPREQKPKPAAALHLQLTELTSCPNPSSQPRSRTPLDHGVLRNSLSAKRQRQLLQKQNKIEYKKEQRVCRANCCSGKTPKLATSSPYRQRP